MKNIVDLTHQRPGSTSNTQVGYLFELAAKEYFSDKFQEPLIQSFSLRIGINNSTKAHNFDFGNHDSKVIVECKSHKWTRGNKTPSAKLAVWNEAMYYFFSTR